MSKEIIEIDSVDDVKIHGSNDDDDSAEPFLKYAKLPSYFSLAFQDLYQEDGLIVFGRGLGILLLIASFCRFYADIEEGHYALVRDELEGEKEKIPQPIYTKLNRKLKSKQPLIFIVGLKDHERSCLISILQRWGTRSSLLPHEITNESGQGKDRAIKYQRGGIYLITSRILIVDLLTNTASAADIDGILVAHAEKVSEKSIEAFIVRIYRTQKHWVDCGYSDDSTKSGDDDLKRSLTRLPEDNPVLQSLRYGFVKAFTDVPEALISGFSKVDRVLKLLFVRKIYLYPRFQADISDDLEHNAPVVDELGLSLTAKMKEIQSSIAVAVKTCITEIKEQTTSLEWDDSDLTLENCITNFDTKISRQVEGDWHRLSSKTKQLVNDLRTLRMLFYYLVQYDCISFLKLLNSIKTMSGSKPSPWLLTLAADRMFRNAKERIYRIERHKLVPVLEENPKWRILHEILTEIEERHKKDEDVKEKHSFYSGGAKILVMVRDDKTLDIVQSYLLEGKERTMSKRWLRYLKSVNDRSRTMAKNAGGASHLAEESRLLLEDEGRVRNMLFGSGDTNSGQSQNSKERKKNRMELNQVPRWRQKRRKINEEKSRGDVMNSDSKVNVIDEAVAETEQFDLEVLHKSTDGLDESDSSCIDSDEERERTRYKARQVDQMRVVIKTYGSTEGDSAYLLLDDVKPRYVILFDLDNSFLRSLEIHTSYNETKTHVYFMLLEESVEEEKYKNSLDREMNAFDRLIQYKKSMHLPVNMLGPWLSGETEPKEGIDTRAGKGKKKDIQRRDIAVDVREFRSALPSVLHQGGMRIAPVTLTIGDYVLSNEHCVERKSISDLFGSFASGRLVKQAEQMMKYYKHGCLLIEFDPEKSFSLQNPNELKSDIRIGDICSKMVLLVQCFPKLRLLWSRNQVETLKIFKTLKANHDEVDVKKAVDLGSNESIDTLLKNDGNDEDEINEAARNMLLKLPGVTVQNARKIMKQCESIADLASLSREEMKKMLGPKEGQTLFSFFRKNIAPT